jgi:RHS repeat-associated protein
VKGVGGTGTLASVTLIAAGENHSLASTIASSSPSYGYDRLGRLTSDGSTIYSYDAVGNQTAKASTTYAYDKADRISGAGGMTYTVNENGNLVARGTDCFSYDQANRLTKFTANGSCASPTATYTYDGDGKRTSKTTGAQTINYMYDGARSLPVVLDDGSRKYVWGPTGLAYSVQGTTVTTYHEDALASVRALSDATGATIQTYTREAFGNLTSSQGSASQPFGFAGEIADSETGFVYLRSRMYDPVTGRFLQRDSLGGRRQAPLSLNRFTYAGNSPATYQDPSGRDCALLAFGGTIVWGLFGGQTYGSFSLGAGVCTTNGALTSGGIIATGSGFIADEHLVPSGGTVHDTFGAYVGSGFSGIYSPQATSMTQLAGPFLSQGVDVGLGIGTSFSVSTGRDATNDIIDVYQWSPPLTGVGLGFAATTTVTDTAVLWSSDVGFTPDAPWQTAAPVDYATPAIDPGFVDPMYSTGGGGGGGAFLF